MKTALLALKKMGATTRGFRLGLGLGLLHVVGAQAQAPAWQAAMRVSLGSNTAIPVRGVATDASGNVYVVGSFYSTATFSTITLTSAGGADAFVAKWNPTRQVFEWARQMGGTGTDAALAVAVNGANVYVVGSTTSTSAAFGALTLGGAGGADGFVTKLTDAGPATAFAWARGIGGSGGDGLATVAVQGNAVYVGGSFNSVAVTLDGIALTKAPGNASYSDGLVARLTDTGNAASFAWARGIGGSGDDFVRVLGVAGPALYVAGDFLGATCMVGATALPNTGIRDVFVVKYTDTGTAPSQDWVQTVGGPRTETANGMAIVGNNVYLAGEISTGVSVFGAYAVTVTSGPGIASEMYIAKLTDNGPTGTFTWVETAGGSNADAFLALAAHGTRLYATGYFISSNATFGAVVLTNATTFPDVVVARLDDLGSSGRWVWAQAAGGRLPDVGYTLAVSPAGTVYAGGFVTSPGTFGSFPVVGAPGSYTGFLASLDDGPLATAAGQPVAGLAAFPTPAHGAITVQLPPNILPGTITLFDALGRPVRRQATPPAVAGTGASFDLTGIAPGVYALRVQAGTYAATQKLVVE